MRIQRISVAVLALLFLGVLFGSLFQVSAGMHAGAPSTGCPYMQQQDALCSMSLLDHLSAWQAHFTATVAPFVQLLLLLTALTVIALLGGGRPVFAVHLCRVAVLKLATILQSLEEKLRLFCHRYLQEFFARGILHPQLFS